MILELEHAEGAKRKRRYPVTVFHPKHLKLIVAEEIARDPTLAAAMVEAELARPKKRRHCEPCPSCQACESGKAARRTCTHTEAEMRNHCRPCVWIGCKHHLYLDVTTTGSILFNWIDRDPDEIPGTGCVLDVAAKGGVTLEEVGRLLGLTRERVRQLEARAARLIRLNGDFTRALREEE